MTSPRIALLSRRDVNMILCGLRILEDCIEIGDDVRLLDDHAVQLVDGATVGEVDQLIARMCADNETMAVCPPCKQGDHISCTEEWVAGVARLHCDCRDVGCRDIAFGGVP